jgi:hypothetical protein
MRKGESVANNITVSKARDGAIEVYCDADLKVFSAKKQQRDYQVICEYSENIKAPLLADTLVGKIKITDAAGNPVGECGLRFRRDVERATYLDAIKKALKNWMLKR